MGTQTAACGARRRTAPRSSSTLDYELAKYGPLAGIADAIFIRRALRDALRRTLYRFVVEAEDEAGLQVAQLPEHRRRALEDVAVGVAAEVVPTRSGLALATPILLPRVPGVVELVAVELDGQAVVWPAAVDTAAAGWFVGDRKRQAFGA